jgi:diadenosine tetraphosphate (Ap4A) HIT family hydrolase
VKAADQFTQEVIRSSDYECRVCGFTLWLPITTLSVSVVGLYDDSRFPGRCIVALLEHREHLSELEEKMAQAFLRDIQQVGRAVQLVTGACRVNYAILGNHVPHVHCHTIPRVAKGDPVPKRTPWEHPGPKKPLAQTLRSDLIEAIKKALQA